MLTIFSLIVLLLVAGTLASYRAHSYVWTPVLAVVLLYITMNDDMTWLLLAPLWIIFIAAAVLFNVKSLRLRFFMAPLFAKVKQTLPTISDTEQEALDAGDVWWEGELFKGNPNWSKMLDMPKVALTQEEQAFIDNQVEHLCAMVDDWEITSVGHDLPPEVWAYLKKEKFWGLCIAKQYGGLGFSAYAHSTIICKIASRSVTAAVSTMVPNSLGPAELIVHYGTEEQKNYYLPRLASGEDIPCFGLTSPTAGSDAASITDFGIVCKQTVGGQDVLGIRLTFDKRYITLAPIATVLGLAVKLYDPEHLLGDKDDLGITLCLIPAGTPGVQQGLRHLPLQSPFMNGPLRGTDVFVPLDAIIGGAAMAGQGWRMLMECLSIGRGISLPALSTGNAKLSYFSTGLYSKIRKQFRMPLAAFEGVEEALARIAGNTYLLEATRQFTVGPVCQHLKPAVASAIAKYHMTEISRQVINDAFDVHAGKAVQGGPSNYLSGAYLGMPVSITVEGANILTRNLIIFGQGAMRCHPYIRQEIAAMAESDPVFALAQFDKLICAHLGYTLGNLARTFWHGLTGAAFVRTGTGHSGPLTKYYKQLTRMSAALALVSDATMMSLGGELKRKERLSARLGDVLSQLYLASATLKHFHDGANLPDDLPTVEWILQQCLYQIQVAFDEFFANFPNRWLGGFLSFMVFPYDRSYKHKPKDKLSRELAKAMTEPSGLRKRMTQYCYVSPDPKDKLTRLQTAFDALPFIKTMEQAIHTARKEGKLAKHYFTQEALLSAAVAAKVLSAEDAKHYQEATDAVLFAVAVDEFTTEQIQGKETSWQSKHSKTQQPA